MLESVADGDPRLAGNVDEEDAIAAIVRNMHMQASETGHLCSTCESTARKDRSWSWCVARRGISGRQRWSMKSARVGNGERV